jgi:hypothetical protein
MHDTRIHKHKRSSAGTMLAPIIASTHHDQPYSPRIGVEALKWPNVAEPGLFPTQHGMIRVNIHSKLPKSSQKVFTLANIWNFVVFKLTSKELRTRGRQHVRVEARWLLTYIHQRKRNACAAHHEVPGVSSNKTKRSALLIKPKNYRRELFLYYCTTASLKPAYACS